MRRLLSFEYFLPIFIFVFSVISGIVINKSVWWEIDKHFSLLSQQFLNRDLALYPINLPQGDFADFHGKQYLFYGPMPSILLLPFVFFFGKNFPQMTISFVSLFVTWIASFIVAKTQTKSKSNAIWLANFFVFGTVLYFSGLVNISAYIVQTVGVAFVMLALAEYLTFKRWFLIGALIAAAGLTRMTLYGVAIFYILELFKNGPEIRKKMLLFAVPILLSLTLLGTYNYKRFRSPFENGYSFNVTNARTPLDVNVEAGFFNLKHIPANLYLLLLKGPDALREPGGGFILKFPYLKVDAWGLGILYTSPLFLYLVNLKRVSFTTNALITTAVLILPSLLYFGLGYSQYGWRYSLDFLPLLYLILLPTFQKGLPAFAKFLIFFGILFNLVYMTSIFGIYPLLGIHLTN